MADEPDDPYRALLGDLAAEHEALDAIVAALPNSAWDLPTPATGWTVRDQIGHLTYFDGTATCSVVDPARFIADRDAMLAELTEHPERMDDYTLGEARQASLTELLAMWRDGRAYLLAALSAIGGRDRLEWYGPPMSAMSFATARLMETWAHGQNVVDAVGAERPATDRLKHIAHLGVRTHDFTYVLRGREVPPGEIRVELRAPSGEQWVWGPDDAPDRASGDAADFCLVVTQRRHPDDTALVVQGPLAVEWLSIAQAFAGGPTVGPAPRG